MIIDCGTCTAGPAACGDCVVSVLLGPPTIRHEIAEEHRDAVHALADSGLIPPLRLVTGGGATSRRPPKRGQAVSARAAGA